MSAAHRLSLSPRPRSPWFAQHVAQVTITSCLLALSLGSGCTERDDDPDTESSEVQALAPDWIHPACVSDALMPPAPNTCAGPWRIDYRETWQDLVTCGEDPSGACTANNVCESWNANTFGDGQGAAPVAPSQASSARMTWSCRRSGGRTTCTGPQPSNFTCTQKADALRSQLIAELPTDSLAQPVPSVHAATLSVTGSPHIISHEGPAPDTGAESTVWDCQFAISGVVAPTSNAWPLCGCAHRTAKTCERTSGTVITAPGLPMPSSPGAPTPPSTGRSFASAPTCLTCDQLPILSDADVQAKLQCFDQQLTAASGDLRTSLIARMKLLYQLAGEQLTGAQRTRIDTLYDENPGASTSCSVAVPWESACQTTATPLGIPGPLQMCADLANNDQTSTGIAALQSQRCIDQLAKTAQLSPNTCRVPIRDLANDAAVSALGRSYPALTGDLATALPGVLSQIGAWWTAATTAAAGDRDWLVGHGNGVIRQLWTNIERAKIPLPTGALASDGAAAALLADITNTGFLDDFGVLSALYAPGQPAATPAVLTLTGDVLQPLADRLARLEILHDVGCRFANCKTAGALRSSATSELVHALAVLPNKAQLTEVLASATHLAQQQPTLFAALSLVRDQHGYLETAWAALGPSEPFAQLATIVEPPAEVAALATIVRAATISWSSYADSGAFVPWHRPRLTTAALQQPALVTFVDQQLALVTQARTDFEAARLATVNDVLAQSRQQGVMQSARDRAKALLDQAADIADRALGLEEREAQERAAVARYQVAFEKLVNSRALDSNAAFQTETLVPFSASAANASYPGLPAARDVRRDRFAVVPMRSGESLRLRVGNKWTPTCAIRSATLRAPDGHAEPIVTPEAETGPEGYWVSFSNGKFTSHSTTRSETTRTDLGASVSACLLIQGGLVGAVKYKIEACVHASYDKIWDDAVADTGGVDARTTASFASGVRVPNTPFPDSPAGSLLAVVTRAGHPNEIIDVRVLQRDDVIYAPKLAEGAGDDVDVHFVVNDVDGCDADTSNALQIEGVKTIPFGNVAKAVGAAMAGTLTAIEAQAPAILAQGQLTAEEATSLRSNAWSTVQTALAPTGISLAGLPYDLRQLFDGFLEREIASIARRGVMHALAREQRQLQISLNALANELAFADAQSRLLMLVPRWRLRDLAGVELAAATDALSETLTAFVAQVYELRDPAAYTQFRSQVAAQLNAVIDLNVTGRFEDSVTSLTSFTTAARNALVAAQFELPTTQRRTVVLAIPRVPKLCGGRPCDHGTWKSVANTVSTAFWTAATTAPFDASLTITPADLYSLAGTGVLACGDIAPVIRRMAMYVDTGDSSVDLPSALTELRSNGAAGGAAVRFPRVGNTLSLEADALGGIPLGVPALNGDVQSVVTKFGPSPDPLGVAAGLSPFTAYHFDMTPFQSGVPKNAMTQAKAVLLVFEVERRLSVANADVPGICQ